jgi:predicted nucleic acid-binding protein
MFLQPSDLGPILSGRSHEEEMIRVMGHYSLDTGDAAILLEAQRAGVMNLATADIDLHRAQSDFDIYSWL